MRKVISRAPDKEKQVIAQGGSAKVRTIGARCETLEARRLLSFTAFPLPGGASAFGISGMASGADGNIWMTSDTPPQVIQVAPSGSSKTFTLPKSAQPARITNGPD